MNKRERRMANNDRMRILIEKQTDSGKLMEISVYRFPRHVSDVTSSNTINQVKRKPREIPFSSTCKNHRLCLLLLDGALLFNLTTLASAALLNPTEI